jgi:hypothetical protein
MEAVIAVLILFGVLAAGGVLHEKASTPASEDTGALAIAANDANEVGPLCGNQGPHYRDLTVPYQDGSLRSTTAPEVCDD